MQKRQNISLEGILIPESFDSEGVATEFALYTPDEEKFIIEPTFSLHILEKTARSQVEIFGIIRQEENKKFIEAHALTQLSNKYDS